MWDQKRLIWVLLGQNLKKILSYFKSGPSNFPICKISQKKKKKKILNLGPNRPYLGTFGLEFDKAIVNSEISILEFLKNESLADTVNFGIGSAFSKVPVSVFSEVSDPLPGPLYKVCQTNT